jgi:ABC-type branched-subunit amino acid transport system substrate-binding protein
VRHARRLSALALAAALLAAGCAAPGGPGGLATPGQRAYEAQLGAARARLEKGQPEEARRALEQLLADAPDAPRSDEALYLLGRAHGALEQPARAAERYRDLLRRYPASRRAPAAALALAEIERRQGRPERAREVLRATDLRRGSDAERAHAYRLLADLSRELGDFESAVEWLAYAGRETTDEAQQREIELELSDLLEGRLGDAELGRLAERMPAGPVRDRVLLVRARLAIDRGDPEGALAALDALPRRLREQDEIARGELLVQARAGALAAVRPLGVALPLSGPWAQYGRATLRGFTLGLGVFEDAPAPYRVVVRDTRGEPAGAERAVRELAAAGVVTIVGPLRSAEAIAAAPAAQELGVPLLTLAPRDDLPFLGGWVFRFGLSPGDQSRALVEHAIASGGRRFAILYPHDERGTMFKNVFWDEVERRGAEVVAVEGYAPGAVDLQVPIKKLVGLHYLTERERQLIAEREKVERRAASRGQPAARTEHEGLPPYVDFDALFLPDEARTAGLVLPQLRYWDVRDVTLLGSSDWNDPALVRIAGNEARGAVFADSFFAGSSRPEVQEFVAGFHAAYGDAPDRIAAEAYDVARVLRGILDGDRRGGRQALQRELLSLRDHAGVSGVTSLDEAGGTRKALALLTVRDGHIVELPLGR